jgi:ABC-type Zn uptake system ZnuABC Zn-binding protein ZnuA
VVTGCTPARPGVDEAVGGIDDLDALLTLPELTAVDLGGEKLRVVATTSIIGDVVGQVGGEVIELTTLIEPGQDPHTFEPSVGQMTAVADSHVILVNGWDLEEGLIGDLGNIAQNTPLVPLSAGIKPLSLEKNGGGGVGVVDPHVWLDPHLVREWVNNIVLLLTDLDPANAAAYERNGASYLTELNSLIAYADQQIESIPAGRRKLVTNHDAFGYFARAYDFEIAGTVIPATSTIAEPSSADLVRLLDQMREADVCTIFVESTANRQLAETVAAELESCAEVQVNSLFSGALGPVGGDAGSYLGMMKANIDAIVAGVK